MKKHIFLAIGVAALYMAAKEYGINSLDDLKKALKPYLGVLDINELSALLETENDPYESGSAVGSMGTMNSDTQSRVSRVPHES